MGKNDSLMFDGKVLLREYSLIFEGKVLLKEELLCIYSEFNTPTYSEINSIQHQEITLVRVIVTFAPLSCPETDLPFLRSREGGWCWVWAP